MYTILFKKDSLEIESKRFVAWIKEDPDGIVGHGPSPNQAAEDLLRELGFLVGLSNRRQDYIVVPAPEEEVAT